MEDQGLSSVSWVKKGVGMIFRMIGIHRVGAAENRIRPSLRVQKIILTPFFASMPMLGGEDVPVKLARDMRITSSGLIAPGTYRIGDDGDRGAIRITGDGITVDFQGATLIGAGDDVDADQYVGRGIWIEGKHVTIRNANVRGYKIGIYAENAPGLRIEGCDVSRNYRQRLKSTPEREDLSDWLYGHENDENQWLRYGAGIYLFHCEGATIERCRARNGQNGLCLVRCDKARVADNDFSFMSGWGLAMWRSSWCDVLSNKFDWCMRGYSHGVYARGQDSAGILVYEQCSDNVFAYNSATHGGDGFFLYAGNETVEKTGLGGCNYNILYRNDFSHAAANGIEATFSSNNIFAENILDECDHGVWAGYSSATLIQGNRMKDCNNGVSIEHGRGNFVIENRFIDTKLGVHFWWDDDRDLLATVFGRSNKGCPSTENQIIGNRFERVGNAVRLADDTMSVVAHNTFVESGVPVDLRGVVTGAKLHLVAAERAGVRGGESEGVALIDEADARQYRPAPLDIPAYAARVETGRGGQNAFLPEGARRGRKYIFIDEWGPYDFTSPRVFPSNVSGGSQRAVQVLGPGGKFRVRKVEGDVEVSPKEGAMPGAIEIRAKRAGVQPFQIELDAGGSILQTSGVLMRADWEVRYYKWSPKEDPRGGDNPGQAAMNWREITSRAPILETKTSSIDFAWGHRGPGPSGPSPNGPSPNGPSPNGPSDRFATVATTSLDLPAGAWRIETVSDDGVRVLIDDREVLSNWTWHGPTPNEATVTLDAGPHTIRIEHFEIDGYAQLNFHMLPVSHP
jgi:parallel beta-helix repeat protein